MTSMETLSDETKIRFIFCITSVRPDAPEHYKKERMQAYIYTNGDGTLHPGDPRFLLMIAPAEQAPLADAPDQQDFSETIRRQHDISMRCALDAATEETPLLPGEHIEHDRFTFLTAPYNGCPERTAVLERTTNYGTSLYLFKSVIVHEDGKLMYQKPAPPVAVTEERIELEEFSAGKVVKFIASNVASGMVSAVGGAIAGAILEKFFPEGVPSYFDEVYAEITRIVGAQLQQSTIEQINGAINNIKIHLQTEYEPAKSGRNLQLESDRQHLFNLLQKYETTYLTGPGGMLGTLMDDKYAKQGLSVFQIGACLHLALYQEMANVDPMNKGTDGTFRSPLESSYGRPQNGTVAKTAQIYAAHVSKYWPKIADDRRAKIVYDESRSCAFGDMTGSSCRTYAYYKDALRTGYVFIPGQMPIESNKVMSVAESNEDKKTKQNPGKQRITEEYNSYRNTQVWALAEELGRPDNIAGNWRALVATPVKV